MLLVESLIQQLMEKELTFLNTVRSISTMVLIQRDFWKEDHNLIKIICYKTLCVHSA